MKRARARPGSPATLRPRQVEEEEGQGEGGVELGKQGVMEVLPGLAGVAEELGQEEGQAQGEEEARQGIGREGQREEAERLEGQGHPASPMTAANQAGLKNRTLMGFIVEYRGGVGQRPRKCSTVRRIPSRKPTRGRQPWP
jgi:hypothetical protein